MKILGSRQDIQDLMYNHKKEEVNLILDLLLIGKTITLNEAFLLLNNCIKEKAYEKTLKILLKEDKEGIYNE